MYIGALMSSWWEEERGEGVLLRTLCGALVMEVGEVGGEEVTQVGNRDAGGGTVQSPCLNIQTDAA